MKRELNIDELPLDDDVKRRVKELCTMAEEKRITIGVRKEITVSVLILIAERELQKPQDWSLVEKALKVSHLEALGHLKLFTTKLGIKVIPLSVDSYIDFIFKKLGKYEQYKEEAHKIAKIMECSRKPSAMAAAIVYYVLREKNYLFDVTQEALAEIVDTTPVSIRNLIKIVKEKLKS